MGCVYACTCGGICPGCASYEPEQYFGQAEDILAQERGFNNSQEFDEYNQRNKLMADYTEFPFDSFSTDELAKMFIDSVKVGDTEFVDALREEIKKRKPGNNP